MIEIKLTANIKTDQLHKFIQEIKNQVIQHGLDKQIDDDLKELKDKLKELLDTKVETIGNERIEGEQIAKYSAPEEAILKYATGADISKYNKSEKFSDLLSSKLAQVNTIVKDTANPDGHMVVRFKTTTGDFETDINQLGAALSDSTFMFVDPNGNKQYFYNPGLDLKKYLKVFCTRDTGDTTKARKRHDHLMDTKGYVEWRLTEAGIKYVKQHCPDITTMVARATQGDFEGAVTSLRVNTKNQKQLDNMEEIETKMKNLRDRKDLPSSTEIFANLITLIDNLHIEKQQESDRVLNYRLVSNYSDDTQDNEFLTFYEEFDLQLRTWTAVNFMPWFLVIVNKTAEVIRKYES